MNKQSFELEICCTTLSSCHAAGLARASRIELCGSLSKGGVTPSFGLMKSAREQASMPIHVLVRPREGDFCYSQAELHLACQDIQMAKDMGMDGIVFGCLNHTGALDMRALNEIMKVSAGMSVTFHRAFDCIPDKKEALEQLCSLGVDRILTSGGKHTALAGAKELKALQEQAKNRIGIMAGAGISSDNICQIAEQTGCRIFHGSFRQSFPSSGAYSDNGLGFGHLNEDGHYVSMESSEEEISKAISRLTSFFCKN